jgi:AcrR family transcriptional regulator
MSEPGPFVGDPADTKEVIMRATYRALKRYGYAELSIGRIADEADLSKSAFYNHYDGKDDLLLSFLDFMLERIAETLTFEEGTPLEARRRRGEIAPLDEAVREELYCDTHRALSAQGYEHYEISSFARRPSQVFNRSGSRVEINPTIITGRPAGSGDGNAERSEESARGIRSSDFLRFTDDSREATIKSHDLSPAADLILRDRIGGGPGGEFDVFPKVGDETKRSVLERLSEVPKTLGDWEVDESPHRVRHRRSFNYWLVATRGGDGLNNMKEYRFPTETARDFAYLAANSSLLYSYHTTYGNMQHFGKSRFRRFPVPAQSNLKPWKPLICYYADLLEEGLRGHIESSGDIDYRGAGDVKELVDEVEFVLGSIYGLSSKQVHYLQEYDSEFARHGPDGYEPTPDPVADAEGDDPVPEVRFGPETERDGDETAPF